MRRPALRTRPSVLLHQSTSLSLASCRSAHPTASSKAAVTAARCASASPSTPTSSRHSNASQRAPAAPHSNTAVLSVPPPDRSSASAGCSCSICTKKGFLHLIVPPSQFQLLTPATALTTYQFGTRVARHLFCSTCGIAPFYRPRSHPEDYDVNVRCLDDYYAVVERVSIQSFDGQHFEQSVASINPDYTEHRLLSSSESNSTTTAT